ncbi:DUF2384 domain-containing protein [Fulvivirga sp. M361]|uniref:antitoxin Xre/MbcA/ParS toxin-binding domain-containing protein n=1 Tax=Fulvivirga sp. M361 TaxID=2594266 RepID=UPI00117B7457|nr:antitoxin Xre/MbcA/ParS toxin-binding domain-containing protein [Fulvivirga sp. M361]TRX60878.1 DUF2384 domain-containing protein [Fulvivirga sp. M361]
MDEKKYKTPQSVSKASEPPVPYTSAIAPSTYLHKVSSYNLNKAQLPGKALLALQEETSLPPGIFADILGISKSKYYDLVKMNNLDTKNIDALADFIALWNKGVEAFDGDKSLLKQWMSTPNENLGGIAPISLLASRLGRRELERAFLRIEHSIYG